MVSFVRAPSPPVRQLKIRTRPSSCFDLHKESTGNYCKFSYFLFQVLNENLYKFMYIYIKLILDIRHQQRENRWSKFVDEHHEEHFQYNYNYNKAPERIVPSNRCLFLFIYLFDIYY
jgi:hypothetical protein